MRFYVGLHSNFKKSNIECYMDPHAIVFNADSEECILISSNLAARAICQHINQCCSDPRIESSHPPDRARIAFKVGE
jgi:hypothetical protein